MKRKRGWLFYPLIIVALLVCAIPAYADIPSIPHAFYGTLTIGGSAAPVGTVVTAKVAGVECGSITTTVAGQYGGSGAFDEKLNVTDEIETGATISFYVNGVDTTQTYAFSPGGVTELNLTAVPPPTVPSVTITALTPDPTNDNTPTFTGTATDTESNISSVEYKVDAGSWTAATATDGAFDSLSEGYTFTTAELADGAHTVYVRATNAATNTTAEANYASDSFTVDTAAPSVTITALTPDPTTDNTPTFTGTATDTLSNISSVEYKIGAGSWTAATASDGAFDSLSEGYTFTTPSLADGAYTVYVRATDAATNTTAEANYASDSFTVDTTPPTVVSVLPVADATGVAIDTTVSVTFSEAMDAATITTGSFTLDGVAGSVSYDSGTYTATFTPDANLALATTYTATLSTAITDVAGNPLAAAYSWSFTTLGVPPTVSSVSPVADAIDVATYTTVTATFDMAMDAATITTSSFTLDGVSGSVSYDSGTYTATFTPDANLASNTTYTATLSTAITSADGIALASAYSWSFTTVYAGDATEDGLVDARDITKVERIIAGLDAATPGGDATQDGLIDARDITKVERIIAGLD